MNDYSNNDTIPVVQREYSDVKRSHEQKKLTRKTYADLVLQVLQTMMENFK